MLPVSLDCPCLIAYSVFSNVYLSVSLDCPFWIAPSEFSNGYLLVSLDCPFLIALLVFSNVYLSVSLNVLVSLDCILYRLFVSLSRLSIVGCPFGIF